MSHAKTYRLRKAALEKLKNKTAWAENPLEPPWTAIRFKKGYRSVQLR
jgi:hypothetical protein